MTKIKLEAQPRDILGKEVKQLRQGGILPAHLYGHNVPSLALQLEKMVLQKALAGAGSSQLIDLLIKGEKKARNVLIREVQKGMGGKLIHVDFFQVSLTEEITVSVSIMLVGESPQLKLNNLTLDQTARELQVKCLPHNIPQSIDLDISPLTEAGQAIYIKDIKTAKGVTIVNSPEEVVARVRAQVVRVEEEAKPTVEEAKVEAPEAQQE